ncbi:HAMP domain-containing protein [Gluconacetobacter entanii]|uniref:histidine kinase n=1 Tax=Gluconacetobacter entanii TaxID=108528 RepID=A0A318QF94_9PROT|nr:ATP-binding protein [Gluconacetobacter entanii]MBE7618585.1 HAMP domain-containing protein [Komagataeibacter sp. FXV2]MBY4639477.1 HAMP domain-containing protein [Gluconacetobacter entanii]MCW4580854.1 ATP-binding protein [Gluconacetobacter entanii]MCW4584243.1 ATP-binding protein [Gluconacetobacter entanii]MCW4587587.1 ATP-binding protein [Gluconacetobacter entanii]
MFLNELFRTATFRLTLAVVAAMIGSAAFQFFLGYSQATVFEARRSDTLLYREAALLQTESAEDLERKVRDRATDDLRVIMNVTTLFSGDHRYIVGDLHDWPDGLVADGHVHEINIQPPASALQASGASSSGTPAADHSPGVLRMLAVNVRGGRVLVLGRSWHMRSELRLMMRHSLLVSIVPTVLFALMTGIVLSHRALARVKDMHEAIDRIMEGDLHERLPAGRQRDDLQRLAGSVNRMLDRLERLMDEIRDVGNDIAHDLRTPLTRVRARLDRARSAGHSAEALRNVIARAIDDLDQSFAVITALLRIGEIENGRRRVGFGMVDLDSLADDIIDLYEPIAESRGIMLAHVRGQGVGEVLGDRDLLIEVLANLVDNAMKFTPEGGHVTIRTGGDAQGVTLEVEDTGIGIPPEERRAVTGRFYRSDKSRHVPGSGLGLSLVWAIVQLHNASLRIGAARCDASLPGAVFTICFAPVAHAPPPPEEVA